MKLTRRALLAMLALAAADPERLIWRPGTKLISIAAPGKPLARGDIIRFAGVYAAVKPPSAHAYLARFVITATHMPDRPWRTAA